MSILVLAEHNNSELKTSTLNAISAAIVIDSNIDVVVIGSSCDNVISKLSNVPNINKVIVVDSEKYINPIAELIAPIIQSFKSIRIYVGNTKPSGLNVQ